MGGSELHSQPLTLTIMFLVQGKLCCVTALCLQLLIRSCSVNQNVVVGFTGAQWYFVNACEAVAWAVAFHHSLYVPSSW